MILGVVDIFDPWLTPFADVERIREVLCLVCNLYSVKLHYAYHVERLIIICQDILGDPQVAASYNSMNREALAARLKAPGDLNVASPGDSLAGLRIIEDGIFLIDVVLRRGVGGVQCRPMPIQCLAYFMISHTTVLISVAVGSANHIRTANCDALTGHLRARKSQS